MSASAPGEVRVAAVVLAAGRSTRMGDANKLLAPIDGTPMIARVVDAALASRAEPVVLVTGHDAERVCAAIEGRDVQRAHTAGAFRGMSASLGAGLAALDDSIDAAIVCLGDMPWIEARHLDALIGAFAARSGCRICVPVHEGRRGNPVLWPKRHFAALRALAGDVGGRALLARHRGEVVPVPIAEDGVLRDVDTPDDLPRN